MELKQILGDRIQVRPDTMEEVNEHGVVILDEVTDKPLYGEVIGVGEGRTVVGSSVIIPFQVKTGDKVIFQSYAGILLDTRNGERLLNESDIIAKVEGE